MDMVTGTFEEHCYRAVERFLRTAVVIDNQAFSTSINSEPVRATRKKTSPLEPAPAVPSTTDKQLLHGQDANNEEERNEESDNHDLKAKELIRAFTRKKIICSVYEPEPPSLEVEELVDDVIHADLLVIDWQLENRSSDLCKQIIKQVLLQDREAGGQLRHITVYTGETNLDQLPGDLLEYLNARTATDENAKWDLAEMENEEIGLVAKNIRILFKNKRRSTTLNGVHENDLPDHLIRDFAHLTDGILPSITLHAIATVRDAAHHSLALFSKDFDGAFITHRCLIPDSEDAETFIEEILSDHFRALVAREDLGSSYANNEICEQWVGKQITGDEVFSDDEGRVLSIVGLKELLNLKVTSEAKMVAQLKKSISVPNGIQGVKNLKSPQQNLHEFIYPGKVIAKEMMLDFARITSSDFSFYTDMPFNDRWLPMLTLGQVVKLVVLGKDLGGFSEDDVDSFYLCVQPRCDSVRLKEIIPFPFLRLQEHPDGKTNIIIREADGCSALYVDIKPGNLTIREFAIEAPHDRVRAKKTSDGLFFQDSCDNEFQWIATLNPFKAQKLAVDLGSQTQRVGMDEFEWLRMQS